MSRNADRHVRFYFGASVLYLIPQYQKVKRKDASEDKWEDDYLEKLRDDVKAKLSKERFDVAYRRHEPIDGALRLYTVDFVVSALHLFSAVQLATPRNDSLDFCVKKRIFSKATTMLERKIADALKMDYVINAIDYEYAASRTFCFREMLEGVLRIKQIVSQNEIDNAGGRVREAIKQFNSEVSDFFESHGWDISPNTTTRRPKDDVYEFRLSVEKYNGYSENEVCGPLELLKQSVSVDEAAYLGIGTIDSGGRVTESKAELMYIIDSETSYKVIDLTVCFGDYDERPCEICDELI